MEEIAAPNLQIYTCNLCKKLALNPVITECGHLFCWSCLFRYSEQQKACPLCKTKCDAARCYPIFIQHQINQSPNLLDASIPSRPRPRRHQKISNPNAIGGGFSAISWNIHNNIPHRKLVAGYSYVPPLVIASFSNIKHAQQGQQDYPIQNKLKNKTKTVLLATILIIILFLLIFFKEM